jgi:hypothetical protein
LVLLSDPLAAVEIYGKFPIPETLTFDDAYIFGEIVRLLIKCEKYDDPRLGPSMISMGRVLGIGNNNNNGLIFWQFVTWLATSQREPQMVCNLMLNHRDQL